MGRFLLLTSLLLITIGLPGQASIGRDATLTPEKIEKMMEIHYIQPHMKSPYDSIEIKDSEAFISIWRDLPPEPDPAKIECVGYQWLLTGRGQKLGLGAAEIFKKFPDLKRITLNFVEVSF